VTVTKEVYAILKQLAKEDRRSISFIANDFIEEGLKKKGKIK
jgi:predicted CopG family antitoxin